jgi:hypothetical protein
MGIHTSSRREGKTSNWKHSRIFIAAAEDVRANGFRGETPLHHAPDEHIADSSSRMEQLCMPLTKLGKRHCILHKTSTLIARLLISHGAAVHAVTNSGRTPLHSARALGIAQALISHGAEARAVENSGRSTASRFSKRTEVSVHTDRWATHWFLFYIVEHGAVESEYIPLRFRPPGKQTLRRTTLRKPLRFGLRCGAVQV